VINNVFIEKQTKKSPRVITYMSSLITQTVID